MVYRPDPWEFIAVNDHELRSIIIGIGRGRIAEDQIHDHIVDLALKLQRYNLLQKYDPSRAAIGSYVYRIILTEMVGDAKRTRRRWYYVQSVPDTDNYPDKTDSHRDRLIDIARFGDHLLKHSRKLYQVYELLHAGIGTNDIAKRLRTTVQTICRRKKEIREEYAVWSGEAMRSRIKPQDRREGRGVVR